MKKLLFVLNLTGTKAWYQGVDKPNIWQRLYKWRTSLKTSIEIYKILHNEKHN